MSGCVHCSPEHKAADADLFDLVAPKVIPADADPGTRVQLEALIRATIDITHENGTLEGTAEAVEAFVREAGLVASGQHKRLAADAEVQQVRTEVCLIVDALGHDGAAERHSRATTAEILGAPWSTSSPARACSR